MGPHVRWTSGVSRRKTSAHRCGPARPSAPGQKLLGLRCRRAEALGHLPRDRNALALRDRAVRLRYGNHHRGGGLAGIVDRLQRMLGELASPAPATKQAARIAGYVGDITRGVGSLLHAKQYEHKHAENGTQSC